MRTYFYRLPDSPNCAPCPKRAIGISPSYGLQLFGISWECLNDSKLCIPSDLVTYFACRNILCTHGDLTVIGCQPSYMLEGLAHFPARKKKKPRKVFNERGTRAHLTKQQANLSSMLIVQPWAAWRGGMSADCCITCSLLSLFVAGECMWNNSDTLYRQDDVRRYILCPPLPSLQ
jgi:hypothetical protein